ncbi:magnesium transporter [Rubeoparvulum massiliense]|uniref:magnesium transporter n=1 Tax=Rubeoparvulum massiliense TaxID=1631346 RepID=UPI00065E363E|nr:magnesium transporter [Rubeoparvulum massiliense]
MNRNLTIDELVLRVVRLLKTNKKGELIQLVKQLQPYDIAEVYLQLPKKYQVRFLLDLEPVQAMYCMQELEPQEQLKVLNRLGIEKAATILDLMQNDDLADLFSEMQVESIDDFLQAMKTEESAHVKNLLRYPGDTAGGLMTNRFVWIKDSYTVREAVDKLKQFVDMAETLNYLYVLNCQDQLVGVVSYRDLLIADLQDKISDIMLTRVISVHVDMDQEEVAKMVERYDFVAIPVVDHEDHLIGIITVDDIIDVVIEEFNEDIERLSASGKQIDFNTSAFTAAARRLPWLVLLLFIGLVSGNIMSHFGSTIEQVVALSYFMPMIAGMTGNTGTQSLAVVVRGMITSDMDRKTILHLIWREFGVGLIIGAVCGTLIATIAYVWLGNLYLGLVVGLSLLLTLIVGTLAGTVIPLALHFLKVDPAIASGPLITTLNDIFSLTIYFSTATYFLTHLL